jgi:hypothetical protein
MRIMSVLVGINGFGRIGRQARKAKASLERQSKQREVLAINDLSDSATNDHRFNYDSNYGTYKGNVEEQRAELIIDGREIQVSAEPDPAHPPWKNWGRHGHRIHRLLHRRYQGPHRRGRLEGHNLRARPHRGRSSVLGVNQHKFYPDQHNIISYALHTEVAEWLNHVSMGGGASLEFIEGKVLRIRLDEHRWRSEGEPRRTRLRQHARYHVQAHHRDALVRQRPVPVARAAANVQQAETAMEHQSGENPVHKALGGMAITAMGVDANSKSVGVAVMIYDEFAPDREGATADV